MNVGINFTGQDTHDGESAHIKGDTRASLESSALNLRPAANDEA